MGMTRPEPLFDWFIPIDGDGVHLGTMTAERPPTFAYLREVVQTAERLGYHALLIPTRFVNGLFDESAPLAETWTMATALAAVTQRIRLLIAIRPGFIAAGLLAKMIATLDYISTGRVDINIVPGGIQGDFERLGVEIDHAGRYEQAEELMRACRALWTGELIDFHGKYITLQGARCAPAPTGTPQFYQGGASPRAEALAVRHAEVYLMWIEPPAQVGARIERVTAQAQACGRQVSFGLRTHLVVRDHEDDAWAAADSLIAQADPRVVQQRQAVMVGTPMVGQQTQAMRVAEHRVGPHLWNGLSTVRVNCGTAIVGTPQQVVEELMIYWRLGVDEFILSGFPHVEECERVSQDVLPRLRVAIAQEAGVGV
ncbi:MAG: LLM class flavin-dependent oxidoreductase [Candidatus Tectomicrobia bacterium]|uniref:LLM class flavin-dependent oxidoreductase n=1 Tax=Tectimicrobiota bacterium TaxID=2528274 RepID=A0A937W8A5_UNCTE|nr:LLM class flavin-dependent oxidoreductase [Candidatus Tectomicrobia bacterium]